MPILPEWSTRICSDVPIPNNILFVPPVTFEMIKSPATAELTISLPPPATPILI